MYRRCELYRQFELKRWIFKEALGERRENNVLPIETETHHQNIPALQDRIKSLETHYGEEAYKKTIQEQVDKIMPPPQEGEVLQILADSVKRYMKRFEEVKFNFARQSEDLDQAYGEAVKEIEEKTQHELSILKISVEEVRILITTEKESLPNLNNKREMNRHFGNYLNALEKHYFKKEIKEGAEWDYGSEFREFQERMEIWAQTRLNVIREDNGNMSQYEAFKKEIGARYQTYAGFDKNSATISSIDLKTLESRGELADQKIKDIPDKIDPKDPDYQKFIRKMEDARTVHPETWKYSVLRMGKNVIERAEDDGVKKKFISEVSAKIEKVDPENKKNDKDDFEQAKKLYLKHLEKLSERGVHETMSFNQTFNEAIFTSTINPERDFEGANSGDEAFVKKVKHEIDILMSGTFTAEKATDLALVKFMRGGLELRNDILSHPARRQELFRAIQAATTAYPEIYQAQYGSIKGDSKDTAPFRLQALIVLGNQAKKIVENYNPKLSAQLEKIQVDPKTAQASVKFRPTIVSAPKFRSALHRGGFNTRDLGLTAMKMLGVITMGINFAQGMSNNKSESSILIRMAKAGVDSLTNPGFLAGAGATFLAYKGEKDPRYLKWPWLSEHEKTDIRTAGKLESIGSKVGLEKRDRFLGNPAEWKLAKKIKADPEKFKKLMELARSERKPGKFEGISPDLLLKAGILDKTQDAAIYYNLNDKSNKTRYLFYNEFLVGDTVDVHEVKEHCTGSSFIS